MTNLLVVIGIVLVGLLVRGLFSHMDKEEDIEDTKCIGPHSWIYNNNEEMFCVNCGMRAGE
jgi:FtsZ-interacting cell division protein ZipA